jgi:hypothetical protein
MSIPKNNLNMATRKIKRTYEQPRTLVVEVQATCPLLAGSNQLNMTNTSNWQEGDAPQNNDEIEIFF